MAVVIRMARQGGKKKPFYRIVAMDKRKQRNGQCLEVLGTYAPHAANAKVNISQERLAYWLKVGARPSETVGTLLAAQSQTPTS